MKRTTFIVVVDYDDEFLDKDDAAEWIESGVVHEHEWAQNGVYHQYVSIVSIT